VREPLDRWHPYTRASGPRQGIGPRNVDWRLYRACDTGQGGVDVAAYQALHTTIDLEGLFDLIEMRDCMDSWAHAEMHNADHRAKQGGY